jgi:serine/threonine protein phosphatase PrpC
VSERRFRSWAATDKGRRAHNEDTYVDRPEVGLWAVADGAGGHAAGEVASGMIAEALRAVPADVAQVRQAIERTNVALREEAARRGPRVMIASTVVALLAEGERFACLWVGDSRAYLLRGGVLRQITRDHSLVQELLEAGAIRPEEVEGHPRGNVITRAVGADHDELVLDEVGERLMAGDRFLLCSDGVSKVLSEVAIGALMGGGAPARALVEAALAAKTADNVTAVVVEVTPSS